MIWGCKRVRHSTTSVALSPPRAHDLTRSPRSPIFVVHYRHEYLPAIEAGRVALFEDHKPVDALIGVKTLAHPGCLIEVEAIAVVDDP